MADGFSYEKKAGKNAKHLTWVDHLKASVQPVAEREDYLAKRAKERAEAQNRAKAKKGPGI